MTYIENIFICLAIPMILSLLFTRGRQRMFTLFVIVGMAVCLFFCVCQQFLYGILWSGSGKSSDRDHTGM